MAVTLRPADLTLRSFARRYDERVGQLPSERGIEHVHAYTYTKTFAPNASGAASGMDGAVHPSVDAHQCLMPIEQFWTANFWHWTTDALPKARFCRPQTGNV